jgi:hypothetical protein
MFELLVEGRFDPPVRVAEQNGAVEASLAVATVVPCFRYRLLMACAQASFGALRGTGLGFDHSREENTFYAAVGLRAGIDIPLVRPMSLKLFAEGHVPLRPTRLETDGRVVWSTPAVAFAAVPMLAGRFP